MSNKVNSCTIAINKNSDLHSKLKEYGKIKNRKERRRSLSELYKELKSAIRDRHAMVFTEVDGKKQLVNVDSVENVELNILKGQYDILFADKEKVEQAYNLSEEELQEFEADFVKDTAYTSGTKLSFLSSTNKDITDSEEGGGFVLLNKSNVARRKVISALNKALEEDNSGRYKLIVVPDTEGVFLETKGEERQLKAGSGKRRYAAAIIDMDLVSTSKSDGIISASINLSNLESIVPDFAKQNGKPIKITLESDSGVRYEDIIKEDGSVNEEALKKTSIYRRSVKGDEDLISIRVERDGVSRDQVIRDLADEIQLINSISDALLSQEDSDTVDSAVILDINGVSRGVVGDSKFGETDQEKAWAGLEDSLVSDTRISYSFNFKAGRSTPDIKAEVTSPDSGVSSEEVTLRGIPLRNGTNITVNGKTKSYIDFIKDNISEVAESLDKFGEELLKYATNVILDGGKYPEFLVDGKLDSDKVMSLISAVNHYKARVLTRYIWHIFGVNKLDDKVSLEEPRESGKTSDIFLVDGIREYNEKEYQTLVWRTFAELDGKLVPNKTFSLGALSSSLNPQILSIRHETTSFANRKDRKKNLTALREFTSLKEFLENSGFYEALPKHINFSTTLLRDLDASRDEKFFEKLFSDLSISVPESNSLDKIVRRATNTMLKELTEDRPNNIFGKTVEKVFQRFYKINKRPAKVKRARKTKLTFFPMNRYVSYSSNNIKVVTRVDSKSNEANSVAELNLKKLNDLATSDKSVTILKIDDENKLSSEVKVLINNHGYNLDDGGKTIFVTDESAGETKVLTYVVLNKSNQYKERNPNVDLEQVEREELIHAITAGKTYSTLAKHGIINRSTGEIDVNKLNEVIDTEPADSADLDILNSVKLLHEVVYDVRNNLKEESEEGRYENIIGAVGNPITSTHILELMGRGLAIPSFANSLNSMVIPTESGVSSLLEKLVSAITDIVKSVMKLLGITTSKEEKTYYDAVVSAVYQISKNTHISKFTYKSERRGRRVIKDPKQFSDIFKSLDSKFNFKLEITSSNRIELLDTLYAKSVMEYVKELDELISDSKSKSEDYSEYQEDRYKAILGYPVSGLFQKFHNSVLDYKREKKLTDEDLNVEDLEESTHFIEWSNNSKLFKFRFEEKEETEETIQELEEEDNTADEVENSSNSDVYEIISRESKKPTYDRVSAQVKHMLAILPMIRLRYDENSPKENKPVIPVEEVNLATGAGKLVQLNTFIEELVKIREGKTEQEFMKHMFDIVDSYHGTESNRSDYLFLLAMLGVELGKDPITKQSILRGESLDSFDYNNPVFRQFWSAINKHSFDVHETSAEIVSNQFDPDEIDDSDNVTILQKALGAANKYYKLIISKMNVFKKTGEDLSQVYSVLDVSLFNKLHSDSIFFKRNNKTNRIDITTHGVNKLLNILIEAQQIDSSDRDFRDKTDSRNRLYSELLNIFGINHDGKGLLSRKHVYGVFNNPGEPNYVSIAETLGESSLTEMISALLGIETNEYLRRKPISGVTRALLELSQDNKLSAEIKSLVLEMQGLDDKSIPSIERPIESFRDLFVTNASNNLSNFDIIARKIFRELKLPDTTTVVNSKRDRISKYSLNNSAFQMAEELNQYHKDGSDSSELTKDNSKYPKLANLSSSLFRHTLLFRDLVNNSKKAEIEFFNMEGVKYNKEKERTAETTTDLGEHHWILTNFINWYKRGILEIMRPETSSTTISWGIKVLDTMSGVRKRFNFLSSSKNFVLRKSDGSLRQTELRFKEEMENLFVGEMLTMWEIKEEAANKYPNLSFNEIVGKNSYEFFDISSYYSEHTGQDMSVFLNMPIPVDEQSGGLMNETQRVDEAKQIFNEYFKKENITANGESTSVLQLEVERIIQDTDSMFNEFGVRPLLANTFRDEDKSTSDLIGMFALESKLYNIYTTIMFFGRASQYKSLYKRMKGPFSTGESTSNNPDFYSNVQKDFHKEKVGEQAYDKDKVQSDSIKIIRVQDPKANYDKQASEDLKDALDSSASDYLSTVKEEIIGDENSKEHREIVDFIQRGLDELNDDTVSAYSEEGSIEVADGSSIIGLDLAKVLLSSFGRDGEFIKAYNWQRVFYKAYLYAKKTGDNTLLKKLKHGNDIGVGLKHVRDHRVMFSRSDFPESSGITLSELSTLNRKPNQAFVIMKFQAMTPILFSDTIVDKFTSNLLWKSSLAILSPETAIGTENERILDLIYGLDVVLATDSALKGKTKADIKGLPTSETTIWQDGTDNYSEELTNTNKSGSHVFEINASSTKEQLRTSFELKEAEILASQVRKLIQTDSRVPIYHTGKGTKKYKGNKFPKNGRLAGAFNRFNDALKNISEIEFRNLMDDLGLVRNEEKGTYEIHDRKAFIKDLIRIIERDSEDRNKPLLELLYKMDEDSDVNPYYEFSQLSTVVDKHLTSIIKKRLAKIKVKGASLTLKTSIGTKDLENYKLSDSRKEALKDKFETGRSKYFDSLVGKLKFYVRKATGTMQAECMVSIAQGDYKNLLNTKEVADAMVYLSEQEGYRVNALSAINHLLDGVTKEGLDFKEKYKKQLTLFGYRIPTSGTNLIDSYTIRQFLPSSEINLIVVPPETVVKVGEDFDIDKKTSYFPSINEDGSLIKDVDNHISDLIEEQKRLEEELKELSEVKGDYSLRLDNFMAGILTNRKTLLPNVDLLKSMYPSTSADIDTYMDIVEDFRKAVVEILHDDNLKGEAHSLKKNLEEYDKLASKERSLRLALEEETTISSRKKLRKDLRATVSKKKKVQKYIINIHPELKDIYSKISLYSDAVLYKIRTNSPTEVRKSKIKSRLGRIGRSLDKLETDSEKFKRKHQKNFYTNQLIEGATDMLLDPAMYHFLVSRVSTNYFSDPDIKKHEMYDGEAEIPKNKLTDYSTALQKRNDMTKGGQDLTGISAIETTFMQLFAAINLTFNRNWTGVGAFKFKGGLGLSSFLNKEEYESIVDGNQLRVSNPFNFRGFTDKNKAPRLKSTILNQVVQATLDAATKSIVAAFNFSRDTMPVAMYLVIAGVPLGRIMSFMTSHVVVNFNKRLKSGSSKREAYTSTLSKILGGVEKSEFKDFFKDRTGINWEAVEKYLLDKRLIGESDYYSSGKSTSMKTLDSETNDGYKKDFEAISSPSEDIKFVIEKYNNYLRKHKDEFEVYVESIKNMESREDLNKDQIEFLNYMRDFVADYRNTVDSYLNDIERYENKLDLYIKTLYLYFKYDSQANEILTVKSASDHDSAPPTTVEAAYSDMIAPIEIYTPKKGTVNLIPEKHLTDLNKNSDVSTIAHFYHPKTIVDIGNSAAPIRNSKKILKLMADKFRTHVDLKFLPKKKKEAYKAMMLRDWIDYLMKRFILIDGVPLRDYYRESAKTIHRDFRSKLTEIEERTAESDYPTRFDYLKQYTSAYTTYSGTELILMESAPRNNGSVEVIRRELDQLKDQDRKFYNRLLITINAQDGMSRDAYSWADMFNPVDWYEIYQPFGDKISRIVSGKTSSKEEKKISNVITKQFFEAWTGDITNKSILKGSKRHNKKAPKFIGEKEPSENVQAMTAKMYDSVLMLARSVKESLEIKKAEDKALIKIKNRIQSLLEQEKDKAYSIELKARIAKAFKSLIPNYSVEGLKDDDNFNTLVTKYNIPATPTFSAASGYMKAHSYTIVNTETEGVSNLILKLKSITDSKNPYLVVHINFSEGIITHAFKGEYNANTGDINRGEVVFKGIKNTKYVIPAYDGLTRALGEAISSDVNFSASLNIDEDSVMDESAFTSENKEILNNLFSPHESTEGIVGGGYMPVEEEEDTLDLGDFTKGQEGIGEEISSYSDNLAFALTNPTHTSPKGSEWRRDWKKGQKEWRKYLSKGITYNGKNYKDVEEAYQKNKNSYPIGERRDSFMLELLKIKLKTYPKLIAEINKKGGLNYLLDSTHQPTKQNSYWETGGNNAFIKLLTKAYLEVVEEDTPVTPKNYLGDKTKSKNVLLPEDLGYTYSYEKFKKTIAPDFQRSHPNGIVAFRLTDKNIRSLGNPFKVKSLNGRWDVGEATLNYGNWLVTGKNFGEAAATEALREQHLKIIREAPEGTKVLYYKELGRPSHATVIDYLISNKDILPAKDTVKEDVVEEDNKIIEENEDNTQSDAVKTAVNMIDSYISKNPVTRSEDDGRYSIGGHKLDNRVSEVGHKVDPSFTGSIQTLRGNHIDEMYRQYNDSELNLDSVSIEHKEEIEGIEMTSTVEKKQAKKIVEKIHQKVKTIAGKNAKVFTNLPPLAGVLNNESAGGQLDILAVSEDGTYHVIDIKSKEIRSTSTSNARSELKSKINAPEVNQIGGEVKNSSSIRYVRQLRFYGELLKQMGVVPQDADINYHILGVGVSVFHDEANNQIIIDSNKNVSVESVDYTASVGIDEIANPLIKSVDDDFDSLTIDLKTNEEKQKNLGFLSQNIPISGIVYNAMLRLLPKGVLKLNLGMTNKIYTLQQLFNHINNIDIKAVNRNFIIRDISTANNIITYQKGKSYIQFQVVENKFVTIKASSDLSGNPQKTVEDLLGIKFSSSDVSDVLIAIEESKIPKNFYRIVDNDLNKGLNPHKSVDDFFKALGRLIGVEYKEMEGLREIADNVSILGVFQSLSNTVQYDSIRDFDTIGEETAHALLYSVWGSLDTKEMLPKYKEEYSELYNYILETYSGVYQTQEAIDFEFMSHVLMEEIKLGTKVKYRKINKSLLEKVYSAIKSIWKKLNEILSKDPITSTLKELEIDMANSNPETDVFDILSMKLDRESSELVSAVFQEFGLINSDVLSPVKEGRVKKARKAERLAYTNLTEDQKFIADNFVRKVIPGRFKPLNERTLRDFSNYDVIKSHEAKFNSKEYEGQDFIVDPLFTGLSMFGITTDLVYSRKTKEWYGIVVSENNRIRYGEIEDMYKRGFKKGLNIGQLQKLLSENVDKLSEVFTGYKEYHLDFNEKFNFIKEKFGDKPLNVPNYLELQVLSNITFNRLELGKSIPRSIDDVKSDALDLINSMIPDYDIENTKIAYQGYNELDSREINYFTLDREEAKYYGRVVREERINTKNMLKTTSDEYYDNMREFWEKTNKTFDILDNSTEGLKTQKEFFKFLEEKGFTGLDSSFYIDSQYIVSFNNKNLIKDRPTSEMTNLKKKLKSEVLNSIDAIYENHDVKLFDSLGDVVIARRPNLKGSLFDGSISIVHSNKSKTGYMFVERLKDGTTKRRNLRDLVLGPIKSRSLIDKASDSIKYKYRMPGTVRNMFIFANNSNLASNKSESPFEKIKSKKKLASKEYAILRNSISELQKQIDYIKTIEFQGRKSIDYSGPNMTKYLEAKRDYSLAVKTKLADIGFTSEESIDGKVSTDIIKRLMAKTNVKLAERVFFKVDTEVEDMFALTQTDVEEIKTCAI